MLWAIAGLLFTLWILGLATSLKLGGLIHALPVVAALVILRRVTQAPDSTPAKRANGMQAPFKRR
jgi:F0F1-type ATP synthase assembly protein I